jgi:hypothetical protein
MKTSTLTRCATLLVIATFQPQLATVFAATNLV